MKNTLKIGIFTIFLFICFLFTSPVYAVTTSLSASQSQITDIDEYLVEASISANVTDGTTYYLRGEFFKPTTTNYCGFTWNGSSWYNGPFTSQGWLNLLPVVIHSKVWSGQLKAKIDTASSACNTLGTYNFRILRYTQGGSSTDDAQTPLTVNLVASTPTPTASPSPSLTPSPTPTNSPTQSPTPSPTPTIVPSQTPTPTVSPSGTPTATPTQTSTATPTSTPTNSPVTTPVATASPTSTPKPRVKCHIVYLEVNFRFFRLKIPQIMCSLRS